MSYGSFSQSPSILSRENSTQPPSIDYINNDNNHNNNRNEQLQNQSLTHDPTTIERVETIVSGADSSMSETEEGQCLVFKDIIYTVSVKTSKFSLESTPKEILHGVNGIVEAGRTLAILGSSGSGKTSLLDVLACRQVGGKVEGEMYLNGLAVTQDLIKEVGGYVMQDDRLLPNLTVFETFYYIASLRMSGSTTKEMKLKRIEDVIAELGLRHVSNNRVGGNTRGLSGGEKRRVSIGVQMILDPSILFLDEPTSGLDAFTATAIVQTLTQLASKNRTVVFTIHQPRSDIFSLFDKVMLLSKGHTVYFGAASQIVDYFDNNGFTCPAYSNPLDYFMDIVTIDDRSEETLQISSAIVGSLTECYKQSYLNTNLSQHIRLALQRSEKYANQQGKKTSSSFFGKRSNSRPRSDSKTRLTAQPPVSSETDIPSAIEAEAAAAATATPNARSSAERPNGFSIVKTLSARAFVNLGRDTEGLVARLTQAPFFTVLLFLFLFRLKNDQASIQNRTGVLYEYVSAPLFIGMLNAMTFFPTQRDVYYRESRDGLYGAFSFIFSYSIHAFPSDVISAFLFSIIGYWAVGLNPEAERFLIFTGVMYILITFGETIGILTLSFFYETTLAQNTTSLIISSSALVASGFLRSTESIPVFLQKLSYATIHKYTSDVLVVNEYRGLQFECPANMTCPFETGQQYIDAMFPGSDKHLNDNIIAIFAYGAGGRFLAVLILKLLQRSLR